LTGDFITRDPLGFAAGDANLYRYAGGNPISRSDPSGLAWNPSGGGGGVWDGGGAVAAALNDAAVALNVADSDFAFVSGQSGGWAGLFAAQTAAKPNAPPKDAPPGTHGRWLHTDKNGNWGEGKGDQTGDTNYWCWQDDNGTWYRMEEGTNNIEQQRKDHSWTKVGQGYWARGRYYFESVDGTLYVLSDSWAWVKVGKISTDKAGNKIVTRSNGSILYWQDGSDGIHTPGWATAWEIWGKSSGGATNPGQIGQNPDGSVDVLPGVPDPVTGRVRGQHMSFGLGNQPSGTPLFGWWTEMVGAAGFAPRLDLSEMAQGISTLVAGWLASGIAEWSIASQSTDPFDTEQNI
jgi:hypothetical protein